MKLPLSWLKQYLDTSLDVHILAETLTQIGLEVEAIETFSQETLLSVAITANLAHCNSIRGMARELAAILQEPFIPTPKQPIKKSNSAKRSLAVRIEERDKCPHYSCVLLQLPESYVNTSPEWLQTRLMHCGIRPINTLVDVTHLVLLELGQPLHAFDYDTLEGDIVIRTAYRQETITSLDGVKRHIPEGTLLIADHHKPIALAGIMGSLETGVTEKTRRVLLEAAYFESASIREACKRLALSTEASYRFVRGTDSQPHALIEALEQAVYWIQQLLPDTQVEAVEELVAKKLPSNLLRCRLSRVNQLLGIRLSMSELEIILRRLGLLIEQVTQDEIQLHPPSYRHDLHQEIDLIEEVARLYGYHHIPLRAKSAFRMGSLPHSQDYLFEKKVRSQLISEGLQEFLTCDLIDATHTTELYKASSPPTCREKSWVFLLNPRSNEQSLLRPSLLPGLLTLVKYNNDHGTSSLAGFEIGRLHFKKEKEEHYIEPRALAVVLTGARMPAHWDQQTVSHHSEVDFFDLKGLLENLFTVLHLPPVSFRASQLSHFHPGRQASCWAEEKELGSLGALHPTLLKQLDLKTEVYFAELSLDLLAQLSQPMQQIAPLAQFPASQRDWTMTLKEDYALGPLLEWLRAARFPLLETVSLLDLYRSDVLGSERKNVTLRFVYRDPEKTLDQSLVDQQHDLVLKEVMRYIG